VKARTKVAVPNRRKPGAHKADDESDVLAAIAKMYEPHRAMGERIHAIIRASAPSLTPRVWYGMPAYARDGKVVCFFRGFFSVSKRYLRFHATPIIPSVHQTGGTPLAGTVPVFALRPARLTRMATKGKIPWAE